MDYDDLMKPFAARLVDALEVDVNVYPPGSGGGGPPGRSFLDVVRKAASEALLECLGRPEILIRQLELKFGPVSDDIRASIEAASSEQRRRWAEQLVTAEHLDDLGFLDSDMPLVQRR